MYSSVENLAVVWASIDRLCSGLPDEEWGRGTGCPGWTVKDHLSHLVDYEARALGRPAPQHQPGGDLAHVKNELGQANEVGVDARRAMSGGDVLAEFREVTAERLVRLAALSEEDAAGPTMTPAGPGTVADMLTLRVMDNWSHEQDIRRAVGRPGHDDGPAVAESVGYFSRFLPYVVGKRAAAPEGAKVAFGIGGAAPVVVQMSGGRGRVAADADGATVSLAIPVTSFVALVCGRSDVPDDVGITGDRELGQRVLQSLGIMP